MLLRPQAENLNHLEMLAFIIVSPSRKEQHLHKLLPHRISNSATRGKKLPFKVPFLGFHGAIIIPFLLIPSFNLEIKQNNEKFIPGLLGLSPFQNVFSLLPSNSQFYVSVSLPEVSEYTG